MSRIPWRRKWQPAPVFLPGKSHGQRLAGYSTWGCKRVRPDLVTEHVYTYVYFKPLYEFYFQYVAAAATAKSLQSCPTLCDPINSSPPSLGFSRQCYYATISSVKTNTKKKKTNTKKVHKIHLFYHILIITGIYDPYLFRKRQ